MYYDISSTCDIYHDNPSTNIYIFPLQSNTTQHIPHRNLFAFCVNNWIIKISSLARLFDYGKIGIGNITKEKEEMHLGQDVIHL